MIVDPTYTFEAVAWSLLWIGAGAAFRRALAQQAFDAELRRRERQSAGQR